MAEPKLKLVPAKCGCEGCFYEHEDKCPGDEEKDFAKCSENGAQKIFVIDEGENNGARV